MERLTWLRDILAYVGAWFLISCVAGLLYAWYRRRHPAPWVGI